MLDPWICTCASSAKFHELEFNPCVHPDMRELEMKEWLMSSVVNASLLRNWKLAASALLFLLATAPTFGSVIVAPSGMMTVDGNETPIPISQNPNNKLWGIGTWDSELEDFTGYEVQTAEFSASLSGLIDPDPMISYGISVTDFGAPSVFGFFFSTPIVPVVGPNAVDASIAGALNDFTGNGVSITPTGPLLQSSTVSLPVTGMGVDVGPAAVHGPGAPGAFYTYGAFSAGPIPGPVGAWTTLSASLGFTLSGGGDIAVLTGFAQIVPVPEPSSLALLGMGAAALALVARRRRK